MEGLRDGRGGTYIEVQLRPGARKERVLGWQDGVLRVEVTAPALEDRANRALVALLAKVLGVPKGAVALTKGGHSRRKTLHVEGRDVAALAPRLPPVSDA
jgi:uncharacterized protein